MWHKIVLQRDVDKTDLHRPTYSHFLCYSVTGAPGVAFPDVLSFTKKSYDNATPPGAAKAAAEFIANQIGKQKFSAGDFPFDVVDPFVGRGTIGVASLKEGLSFLGLDIDKEQCRLSRELLEKLFS
jgi:hypothetical protein